VCGLNIDAFVHTPQAGACQEIQQGLLATSSFCALADAAGKTPNARQDHARSILVYNHWGELFLNQTAQLSVMRDWRSSGEVAQFRTDGSCL